MYVWCPLIWGARACNYLYTVLNILQEWGKPLLLKRGILYIKKKLFYFIF